ncbi:hypothetical protein A1O1_09244 [Capronia coronata CBS 617.96]|uniref:HhH-GPD domain-containing protein n=1 Tax=Capronia coronata CBS 617.96 TaxID=1182541 RepID=W9XEG6_9EURO|nr:uncharacterized protein A1O1_09244 [Capronia coronata CBS 617.96]EXJ78842.1 hypothetical protein A1O1_09244 [Capronia coronata CBS 617.96]
MVQTRSHGKPGARDIGKGGDSSATGQKIPQKRSHSKTEASNDSNKVKVKANKRAKKEEKEDMKSQSTQSKPDSLAKSTIATLIEKYGSLPLSDSAVDEPLSPKPETMLALLLNAMFSSARISHELAAKTLTTTIKAGYHKINVLKKTSWDERTRVLTEGGYTRYREKTATALGDLVEFLEENYQGDLNNLLPGPATDSSPSEIRKRLKEIKGLGDVGVDIFCDAAQAVWPCLAPFVDPRSAKTAEAIGIPSDAQALWESEEVNKDPMKMARLAAGLTTVRLEKKETEFKN